MKNQCMTLAVLLYCSTLFSQVFVKSDATGSNNGSSWGNAFTSLSDAIDGAAPGDEIWVAAGTYLAGGPGDEPSTTYFFVDKTLSIYGGFSGTETNLADRDVSANETILSADLNGNDLPGDFEANRSDNGYHVLWLSENSEGSTVDGFTIRNGNSKYGNPPIGEEIAEWAGAGIAAFGCSCLIQNCTFQENGGAIGAGMLSTGGASVSVQGCLFENNNSDFGTLGMDGHLTAEIIQCDFMGNASTRFGGGVTIGNTNASVLDCNFTGNTAMEEGGGGLFVFQNNESEIPNTVVSIQGTTFMGNSAPDAGGFLMNNFADGSQLLMEDCVFENNFATASDGQGGGFSVKNQGGNMGASNLTFNILDCEIKGNTAPNGAGAFIWSRDFNLILDMADCVFTENTAENVGGGLELSTFANGRLFAELNGVEFLGNNSEISGAGLNIVNDNMIFQIHATLTDCLFEENTSPGLGGAISTSAGSAGTGPIPIVTVKQSGFYDNSADAGCGAIWASSTILTVSDCLFEGNSTLGELAGGGAIGLMANEATVIERCVFSQNSSAELGGAFYQTMGKKMAMFDNVVFQNNMGSNVIYTEDSLMLRNVSLVGNPGGLTSGGDEAVIQAQNTIFADSGDNFVPEGEVDFQSLGGNVSDDHSLETYLTGAGGYDDQHGISPMLIDLRPAMGSPCVDRGNPDGISDTDLDADGELRIQGSSVDVGAYESSFTLSALEDREVAASAGVFPNPFSDVLNIQSDGQPEAVRLFDTNGKVVAVFPKNESRLAVGKQLAPGQYIVEFVFENGTVQKKVVKK